MMFHDDAVDIDSEILPGGAPGGQGTAQTARWRRNRGPRWWPPTWFAPQTVDGAYEQQSQTPPVPIDRSKRSGDIARVLGFGASWSCGPAREHAIRGPRTPDVAWNISCGPVTPCWPADRKIRLAIEAPSRNEPMDNRLHSHHRTRLAVAQLTRDPKRVSALIRSRPMPSLAGLRSFRRVEFAMRFGNSGPAPPTPRTDSSSTRTSRFGSANLPRGLQWVRALGGPDTAAGANTFASTCIRSTTRPGTGSNTSTTPQDFLHLVERPAPIGEGGQALIADLNYQDLDRSSSSTCSGR